MVLRLDCGCEVGYNADAGKIDRKYCRRHRPKPSLRLEDLVSYRGQVFSKILEAKGL